MEETQPEMTRTKTMWYKHRRGRGSPEGGVRGSSTKDLLFHVCDLLPDLPPRERRERWAGLWGSSDLTLCSFLQPLYVTWLSLFIPELITGKMVAYRRSGDGINSEKSAIAIA